MIAPRYYCPTGATMPRHTAEASPIRIQPGFGCDPAKAGGMHYGGTPDWSLAWIDSGEGWWYSLADVHPSAMLRSNAIRGLAVGEWIVPTLMRADGTAALGYWCANGFVVPQPYAAIIDRLRNVRDDLTYTDLHAELAVDVLALNYHASIHELGELRALTVDSIPQILRAACGIPPSWAAKQDEVAHAES